MCVYILCIYGGEREEEQVQNRKSGGIMVDFYLLFFFIFQVVYNKPKLPLNWGNRWIEYHGKNT